MAIRVLLVDDHRLFRSGLRSLLESEEGIEVVGEASNGRAAIEMLDQCRPTVVVMDITMPDLNGVEATRQVLDQSPEARVIALSMHSDRRFIEGMLRAGASGYLLKDCASKELVQAVRAVADGQTFLSPSIAEAVVGSLLSASEGPKGGGRTAAELSGREREVLQLLAEGLSAKEIAHRLHLSSKTIETHRANIMSKLDLHSIADLTKYAIREGLTPLDM